MGEEVKETNSGVKKEGNWKDIAEFGEKISRAMERAGLDEKSRQRFDEWRPKVEESERDVRKKTVDKAVLDEKEIEKESNGVKEDLREASGKAAEAGVKAAKRKNPEKEFRDASLEVARPFYSKFAELFRSFENFVYSNIVLALNPYYLDTADFSADMKHKNGGKFEMDVSVPIEQKRKDLKEDFREDRNE